ncbi:hypothetical protein PV10_02624 [Exophiala mesophila]|uniref:Mannosyltransferase n=1 Tax=Exophiala mesophila TaxID=212818 RepID=A0A0D2A7D8_EXOME|nr:uncharacterized protein PV10_02624 [Exophiala mesophila]KIV94903.1 hypothetical protein PV10_02624 [Exophiala mesophila]
MTSKPKLVDSRTGSSKVSRQPEVQPIPPLESAPVRFFLPLNIAFYLLLSSHAIAALYAPIQDCDETYNYWEPLHYLTHGYGRQTWEYSPEFGIRSWAYILIHAIPAKIIGLLSHSKTTEFYGLRLVLAAVCASTETRLYSAISRILNPRIAIVYLMIVAFSPGFFYASAALLPSSFAMYTSALGLTCFIDRRAGLKTASGIMWFAIGGLLGWPFAAALILPFVAEDFLIAAVGGNYIFDVFVRYLNGAARSLVVLALQVGVDSLFFGKLIVVPWQIVAYNVFGGQDRGPDIFGTEPWHYYARNLLLNFNLWFILAVISAPLFILQSLILNQASTAQSRLRTLTLLAPFYLWLGIFSVQPHKEERFIYPAYPFLALNAAIAFHSLLVWIGSSDSIIFGKIPTRLKFAGTLPVVFLAINIGLLRIAGTLTAYRAPLEIYSALNTPGLNVTGQNICLGKDWYRFPSSHFLPNDSRAKFIKSEFDGLLPGEYPEWNFTSSYFPGTWIIPDGMNDLNQEDPGKHVDIEQCTYLVDSQFEDTRATEHEPLYIRDDKWEHVSCIPFLDTSKTGLIARTIWVPDIPLVPPKYRRHWGQHCLLRRKTVE